MAGRVYIGENIGLLSLVSCLVRRDSFSQSSRKLILGTISWATPPLP